MHPLIRTRQRALLYLSAWALIGVLLASLLWIGRIVPFPGALAVMGPLGLMCGVIGLSALWVCRSLPLDRTPVLGLLAGWFKAGVQASAVWVALATVWSVLLVRL